MRAEKVQLQLGEINLFKGDTSQLLNKPIVPSLIDWREGFLHSDRLISTLDTTTIALYLAIEGRKMADEAESAVPIVAAENGIIVLHRIKGFNTAVKKAESQPDMEIPSDIGSMLPILLEECPYGDKRAIEAAGDIRKLWGISYPPQASENSHVLQLNEFMRILAEQVKQELEMDQMLPSSYFDAHETLGISVEDLDRFVIEKYGKSYHYYQALSHVGHPIWDLKELLAPSDVVKTYLEELRKNRVGNGLRSTSLLNDECNIDGVAVKIADLLLFHHFVEFRERLEAKTKKTGKSNSMEDINSILTELAREEIGFDGVE